MVLTAATTRMKPWRPGARLRSCCGTRASTSMCMLAGSSRGSAAFTDTPGPPSDYKSSIPGSDHKRDRLELLHELVPTVTVVALLDCPTTSERNEPSRIRLVVRLSNVALEGI